MSGALVTKIQMFFKYLNDKNVKIHNKSWNRDFNFVN